MAKAKFGALVTDVRGKLGGHVFQGNGFSASVRTGYSGSGGFGSRNTLFTDMNSTIDRNYRNLTATDKQDWDLLASKHPIADNFGDYIYLTGQNLYRRNYTAYYSSGQTGTIDPAAAIGILPSSELEFVLFKFANQEIEVQFQNDRFSDAIIVYGRPVSRFGLAIQTPKLPYIYGEKDETPDPNLLWDAFFAQYPAFQEGDACQFGVVQVNLFGFQTFRKVIYGTFV